MTPKGNGLFNTSGAGEWFRRFRLGKRKAFARARRATARRAIPILTPLEQRHLLSFTATWIGQNGSDFVGTVVGSPNDYQDVVIHLSGLSNTVSEIYVQRYGGGAWDYKPSSSTNAFFQASSGNPEQGDLYLEPYFNDPTNYWYELIRVFYVDGSQEEYNTLHSGTPVDANLRDPGRGLSAQWLGQDGNDWTGNGPSVGPDGIQDFRLKVSNISTGGTVSSLVLTANPGTSSALSWQFGTNPQGYSNAELLNRVTSGSTDTADYFGNPSSSLSNGAPLTLQLTYSDQNRGGKTDTIPISAGLTVANIDPTLTMPQTPVSNFATATAHSTAQDAGYPGFSHIVLDTPLPNPETTATVQAAVLNNQAGSTWVYGSPTPYTGTSPLSMSYDPGTGVFSFPPVRDEGSATLTLRLLFADGTQSVARVAGATSDPRRRDQPVGTSSENVGTAALLMDAVNRQIANIHLAAGTYLMSAPLNLNYPVKITADPGASMVFTPSPSDPSWTSAPGAIGVWASHVSLDGFAISFQGDSALWAYSGGGTRAVIQSAGNGGKVDLSYTNLNIQAPAAHTAGEEAVHLMNFDSSDSGQIIGNILKGGTISLWNGPWQILNNDYTGTPANTVSYSVFFIRNEHDVLIQNNHIHSVTGAGVTYRFLLFGASDTGRGFNDVIQNNTVDGGIGRPANDNSNNPEIILTEQFQPRFEGTPSSVTLGGYVLQVPYMRGPNATTGDVVAILSGPQAGQWRLIAQALSPTQYLLDSPLPTTGDYTIAIGRGWVNDTYQGNTIDLRSTNPGNTVLNLQGGHFDTRVLNNTFLGSIAISISAYPTEGAFSGTNPPPWGWTHLPIFEVAIDGNTFVDASVSLNVSHSKYIKSSSGRTYFSGSFTNNAIEWSAGAQPGVTVGIPAQNGEAAYTHQNFPWLDDGELVLTLQDNWGVGPAGAAASVQVIAGTIWDGSASQGAIMENQSLPLPTSPPNGPTLTATAAAAAGEIDLSWSVLGGATGYKVERSPEGLNWTQIAAVGATTTSLQDTGLASSATYYYRVRASTAGSDSPYSNTANAATQPMPGLVDGTAETGGIITARGENLPSEGRANAFDNNIYTKWLDFSSTSWIQYQFANNAAYVITEYTITSANDTATYPGRAPKSWVLEGSNDGSSWTPLDIRTNQADTANFDTRTYDFSNTTAYKIYRLDSIVSNGDPIIQIAEIKWLGPNVSALTDRSTNAGGTVLKSGEYTPDGTLASNAFDGNPQTKWMWVNVPSWIGYQFASGNRYVITNYSITSANDLPTRDPKEWTFEASNDGSTWTVLDSQTNQDFDQRFQVRDFPINNGNGTGTAYAYYRLNISATHNDPFVQLADLKLLGPAQ